NKILNELYLEVRNLRESLAGSAAPHSNRDSSRKNEISEKLGKIAARLDTDFPDDWLLRLELLELNALHLLSANWESSLRKRLDDIVRKDPGKKEMIQRGLELI